MHLALTQGQAFRMAMYLQRYNYQTGMVEPVDLTGASAKMTLRKSNYEAQVTLEHPMKNIRYTKTIQLTEAESLAMQAQPDDNARQQLLGTFASAQAAMQELRQQAATDEQGAQIAGAEPMP